MGRALTRPRRGPKKDPEQETSWERDVPGAGAATADNNNLFRQAASTLQAKSLAIVGASERARWPSEIYRNLREFGYPGPHRTGQSAADASVRRALLPVAARPARAGRPCAGDRAGRRRCRPCSPTPRPPASKSATVYASMMGDGDDPESQQRGAWLKEFVADEPAAGRRPELHGRLLVPRAAARLSQHRAVLARAGLGRLHLPVRRH